MGVAHPFAWRSWGDGGSPGAPAEYAPTAQAHTLDSPFAECENAIRDERRSDLYIPDSIRDDAHLGEALGVIDTLIDKAERSPAEEMYLGALSDLVETYEAAHVAIPPCRGVEALRYLMEENGLSQADLVPLLGTASVVSEVLAGKRRLSLSHIERLAAHFGLPADVFIATSPAR